MNAPVDGVDARTDRVAQSAVGVALLAAFVFRVPLVVPVLLVILGVSAALGPRANALHHAFERWIAPRLPGHAASAEDPIPTATVRAQDAFGAAVLAIAGVAFVLGIAVVCWALAVGEAVVAIVAATTRFHVADRFRRRL